MRSINNNFFIDPIKSPVSVIIPTKNRNEYLKRAIESVILQEYPYLEICIVDNNNDRNVSAGVQEIVEDYKIKNAEIKWIYLHSRHKYASGAKNDGMNAVSYKYICFLDDDDELLKDSIAVRVKEMLSDANLSLVYCAGYSIIYPYPFKIYRYYHHYQEKSNKVLKMMSCSSMLINKEIFEKNEAWFDQSLSRLEDYDLGKTIMGKGMKIKSVAMPLVTLHHHPNERMSTYTPSEMDFRGILVDKWPADAEDYVYNYIAGHFIWRKCFEIDNKKYLEIEQVLEKEFHKTPSARFRLKYKIVSYSPLLFLAIYHCSLVAWQFYQNKLSAKLKQ